MRLQINAPVWRLDGIINLQIMEITEREVRLDADSELQQLRTTVARAKQLIEEHIRAEEQL